MAADTAVEFFLESLKQLLNSKTNLIIAEKDEIELLHNDLGFLRNFLKNSEERRYEYERVNNLVTQIRDAACEAEDIIELFLVNNRSITVIDKECRMAVKATVSASSLSLNLSHVRGEIEAIKMQVTEIYDKKKKYGIGVLKCRHTSSSSSSGGSGSPSRRGNTLNKVEEEPMVGFEDEVLTIKERLTGGPNKLEVISIVGMAGLGKATLANKIYNDPLTVYHFHIRGWTNVSQVYQKRDLLIDVLGSAFQIPIENYNMSDDENKLGEELFKRLKGRRYLIVVDDIWSLGAWDDLKRSFPNDNNGSRVLLTSRLIEMANFNSNPRCLRFLNEDESWDLLQQKVFAKEKCPIEMVKFGKQIARKCQGLPLAIIVIAGLLAKKAKTKEWWSYVARSLSSYIASDPEQYLDTLALSYNHLPLHLKPCLLYLGAFPEDYEIPVRKLIWLWIAEGFIQRTGQKNLEDIAEDYLMELIDRSLVVVARKRSDGGVKSCRIHDLLHDLCLRKAKEENFLQYFYREDEHVSSPSSSSTSTSKQRRLYIHRHMLNHIYLKPYSPHLRSFLCFGFEKGPYTISRGNTSFLQEVFKLLRVLDLISISIACFPNEIEQIIHLRYLALWVVVKWLPESIFNLWNLETLILGTVGTVSLPYTIWKMVKLRHLYSKSGEYHIDKCPRFEAGTDSYPSVLTNLQTISRVCPCRSCQDVLERAPNLRRLGISGSFISLSGDLRFPNLDFLDHLQTLKLINSSLYDRRSSNFQWIKFPKYLRRLTLKRMTMEWKETSTLGMLPNLEVLKLLNDAFNGPSWETSDGGFPRLKFLKFCHLDIVRWNASTVHFPILEQLVLEECKNLEEIPLCLGDIPTLHLIEVKNCSHSAKNCAHQIKEEQKSIGNDYLKILIKAYD